MLLCQVFFSFKRKSISAMFSCTVLSITCIKDFLFWFFLFFQTAILSLSSGEKVKPFVKNATMQPSIKIEGFYRSPREHPRHAALLRKKVPKKDEAKEKVVGFSPKISAITNVSKRGSHCTLREDTIGPKLTWHSSMRHKIGRTQKSTSS